MCLVPSPVAYLSSMATWLMPFLSSHPILSLGELPSLLILKELVKVGLSKETSMKPLSLAPCRTCSPLPAPLGPPHAYW